MAKKKGFKYRGRERTAESVHRASKASNSTFDSILVGEGLQFYKPREGENNIRLLPPTWSDLDKWGDGWHIDAYVHYNIGLDNSAYLCLEKMTGEPCPICEAKNETKDETERKAFQISRRALVWLIDRDNEKAGPQAWIMPLSLFREINTRCIDKKTGKPILIDDPDEGYDVSFVKEGKEIKTKYLGIEIARDSTPLSSKSSKQDQWLEYIQENPLTDMLNFYDSEHISKVLTGQISAKTKSGDDDDEDEKPSRRRRSRTSEDEEKADSRATRRNKRNVSRDDDDDDEEEEIDVEDDEDEEEDEKPSRSNKKSKSRNDDDDDEDDDDDDEDEDEEDEKPAKGKGKGKARDDDEDDDDDDEDEEEDEDDDPPSKRRASKGKSRDDDEDDDDDEDEDEDEDDDEDEEDDDEPKGKKGRDSAAKRAKDKLSKLKNKKRK